MKVVGNINFETVNTSLQPHLLVHKHVSTDEFPALNAIDRIQEHGARVTPCSKVDECLPWGHIAIWPLKSFLLGLFHGVTKIYLLPD